MPPGRSAFTETGKPKRNAVRLLFTIEDAARIPGPGVRADAGPPHGADRGRRPGDFPRRCNGATPNAGDIVGLVGAGITETTITQANKVLGPQHPFGLYRHGGRDSREHHRRPQRGRGRRRLSPMGKTTVINSTNDRDDAGEIPSGRRAFVVGARRVSRTTTANNDFRRVRRAQDGHRRRRRVAAVWEAGELIRDPYSGAAKGEVALTLCYLWDFGLPRTSNFQPHQIREL